ncbi:VRR-NUC domain-containing protein [Geminisphaera colitermitum]|uniref:VRR-NUC domain-containing protein n=1 Tax=Geminisphaera colitermitum TaxID=1148786 RepID=UPI000158D0EB|nr:VRR-NUC domain-containing protein [Geminisphaera colitermitum]
MPRHIESRLQAAFVAWWNLAHRGLGVPDARLLFAVPNGGARNAVTGSILKGEGVRAGIPDICLAVPNITRGGKAHGLFLEFKTTIGRVREEQQQVMSALRGQGYEAVVVRTFDQAQQAVTQYLTGREIAL